MLTWMKHWRTGESVPEPRGRRVEHFGPALARRLAADRHAVVQRELGDDHPATRAARGRLAYHQGMVPQLGSTSLEAIGWYRESGQIEGYLNRTERRRSVIMMQYRGEEP